MGIYATYKRLTRETLAQALANPADAWTFLDLDGIDGQDFCSLDKAWQQIWTLLRMAGAPRVLIDGTPFPDAAGNYGPARYLDDNEVAQAATFLADLPAQRLLTFASSEYIAEQGYGERRDLFDDMVGGHYRDLPGFFAMATKAHDAVAFWLH